MNGPELKIIRNNCRRLLVAVLIFCMACPPVVFAQEKPVGKIIGITGTVEFLQEGEEPVAQGKPGEVRPVSLEVWKKVGFHQPVYASDRFRTSKKSRLKIKFSDNSLMALGPNSEMSVKAYHHQPENNLRQGIIEMRRGLSMYIINKNQKNKESFFNIISSTANMAARGTQGYISVTPDLTLIANQAGVVSTRNADLNVKGTQTVGPMMKTAIARGQPPTPPKPLTLNELSAIKNVVLARVAPSAPGKGGKKPLIEVQEKKQKKKKKKTKSKSPAKTATTPAPGQTALTEQEGTEPATDGEVASETEVSTEAPTDLSGEIAPGTKAELIDFETNFVETFTESFDLAKDVGLVEGAFTEVNQPFNDSQAEACTQ